jgi:hypothetical protein
VTDLWYHYDVLPIFLLVLFDKTRSHLSLNRTDFTSIASITLDVFIICALCLRLSCAAESFPLYMRFFNVSVLPYAIDLGYYTLDMKGMSTRIPDDVGYT